MFLSEPQPTAYDIRFSFLGFPVRVHPGFFVLPVLFGRGLVGGGVNPGVGLLLIAGVFFVSILVHELGHAIAFRYYGIPSRIVLYWLGGLAIPDQGNVWGSQRRRALSSNEQIVVSLAGPIFGFLLAGVLVVIIYAMGGSVSRNDLNAIPLPQPELANALFNNESLFLVFFAGIAINIFLNLLNLVPIYPLDGGQVAREVMIKMDRQNGVRNSIYLSIGAACLIALFALTLKDTFMAIFFGFMAYSNFQMLEQYGRPRW